ncbi:response regulator [Sphingomonas aerolata]|uniref:response regulator transcription factor n=1 Tax=Sphingomonas aerolata TaxID=185951 RepID=UPI002FE1C17F
MRSGQPDWGASMRILIVEDHADLVTMLIRLLGEAGYAADATATAADARLILSYTRYAAVILDLGLPDGDGLSVVRELRDRDDPTPVIALTARASVAHRVTGLEAGATTISPSRSRPRNCSRASRRCSGAAARSSTGRSSAAMSGSIRQRARSPLPAGRPFCRRANWRCSPG